MGIFKMAREIAQEQGWKAVAKITAQATGAALWQFAKTYCSLVSIGIPLGIGITLGAAMVWNAAVRLASL